MVWWVYIIYNKATCPWEMAPLFDLKKASLQIDTRRYKNVPILSIHPIYPYSCGKIEGEKIKNGKTKKVLEQIGT